MSRRSKLYRVLRKICMPCWMLLGVVVGDMVGASGSEMVAGDELPASKDKTAPTRLQI